MVMVVVVTSVRALSLPVILVGLLEFDGRPLICPVDPAAVGSKHKQNQQRSCLWGEKVRVARHSGTRSEIGTIYILALSRNFSGQHHTVHQNDPLVPHHGSQVDRQSGLVVHLVLDLHSDSYGLRV